MVIQDHQRVEDIKKVENVTQGMEIMYITPRIEAEDNTVRLVPAAVLLQIMNHQIQIHSTLQMTVSIHLDQVLMTVTFHLKDIVINHTEGDCYMRSITMTKTTDFIINQGVCCCLKVEKIQVMKISCLKLKTKMTQILRSQESLGLFMILQLPEALVLSRSSFTDLIILNVWPR